MAGLYVCYFSAGSFKKPFYDRESNRSNVGRPLSILLVIPFRILKLVGQICLVRIMLVRHIIREQAVGCQSGTVMVNFQNSS